MDKETIRLAKLYYADYADEHELLVLWKDLSDNVRQQWYDYAERRLNG